MSQAVQAVLSSHWLQKGLTKLRQGLQIEFSSKKSATQPYFANPYRPISTEPIVMRRLRLLTRNMSLNRMVDLSLTRISKFTLQFSNTWSVHTSSAIKNRLIIGKVRAALLIDVYSILPFA